MSESNSYNFNNVLRKIIKKSLFTERQIEIILNYKNLVLREFNISKGAYFRQVAQSRKKLIGFYYTVVILRSLGIILPDDIDVTSRLSEQISVMGDGDVSPEKEEQITSLMESVIQRTTDM